MLALRGGIRGSKGFSVKCVLKSMRDDDPICSEPEKQELQNHPKVC